MSAHRIPPGATMGITGPTTSEEVALADWARAMNTARLCNELEGMAVNARHRIGAERAAILREAARRIGATP